MKTIARSIRFLLVPILFAPSLVMAGACDAHFTFDGTLADSSGSGHDAVFIDTASKIVPGAGTFVAGKIGQALKLDGETIVLSPLNLQTETCPQVSITAWVYLESAQKGGHTLLSTGFGRGPRMAVTSTNLSAWGGANEIRASMAVRQGLWIFVAGVWDYKEDVHRLYWRQRSAEEVLGENGRSPQDGFWIGAYAYNSSLMGIANGVLIDDLRVHGRLLSEEELDAIRDEGNAVTADCNCGGGLEPTLPTGAATGIDFPSGGPTIDPDDMPDRPTDILAENRTPLSRAQILLNKQGAIAYLSVGTNLTAPLGNTYFKPKLFEWRDAGKRITEIAGVPGQNETVAVAEFSEFGISPDESHMQLGIQRRIARAVENGERIDLIALPPSAQTDRNYFLVTDKNVYARGIPQAAVQVAENALAAGEEVSATVFPTGNSFAIATSSGIYTANLPPESNLKAHLQQLHQAGERIEDIVIHPLGFGWSGETGSYAIATNRRIVGVHVSCGSFDRAQEWAQDNGVPRQITCEGDRPQVADEIPPQDIPDLELGDNQCEWGFRGTLSVHHGLPLLRDEIGQSPLANVKVRVVGSKPSTGNQWLLGNPWPTVRTDEYGRFAIREAKDCGRRRMKLEIKFQDDELEVRHRRSTSSLTKVKWYELDTKIDEGGSVVIADYELGQPADEPGILVEDAATMWWHADIWTLYKTIIGQMKSRGPEYAFYKQVKIKYPHDGIAGDDAESAYANPQNGVIYIPSVTPANNFTVDTLVHELGHIWSYQHSITSTNSVVPIFNQTVTHCLTAGLLEGLKFETHGLVSDRCVAFHEGFAEFYKDHVLYELFGNNHQLCRDSDDDGINDCQLTRPVPYSRAYLAQGPWPNDPPTPLTDLQFLERHDMGWYSAFHALTDRNRSTHLYGPPTTESDNPDWFVARTESPRCNNRLGPQLTFWDILKSFNPGAGYPAFRPIGLQTEYRYPTLQPLNDTRLDNYLERLAATSGKMTPDDIVAMRRMIDPAESVEAWDLYCP